MSPECVAFANADVQVETTVQKSVFRYLGTVIGGLCPDSHNRPPVECLGWLFFARLVTP